MLSQLTTVASAVLEAVSGPEAHLDFETFSRAELRKCGAYRYAHDESTEVLIACFSIGDQPIQTWVPYFTRQQAVALGLPGTWHYGKACPAPLAQHIRAGRRLVAHNAQFERAIWENVVAARYGGPRTKVTQWVCTAVRCAANGLPRSLEHAGMALETNTQKDKEGERLIKLFCMPRKPTKNDKRDRNTPEDFIEDFKMFCSYCKDDVGTERDIDKIVPQLHQSEQRLFAFDMMVNERGFPLDIPLVRKTLKVVTELEAGIVAEVQKLTKCEEYPEGLRPTQRDKMLKMFHKLGVALENMQADHVRKYMKTNKATLKPLARRLLELRIEASKASTKKLMSMLAYALEHNDRALGTLLMYGAHTGRWSGKGVQPHNFIRGTLKPYQQNFIFDLLQHADSELMTLFYEWPINMISQCMRGFIKAKPGHILRVVDYSSIEARVLAWLAQQMDVLNDYRNGLDAYRVMAAALYNLKYEDVGKESEQRRIGKNLVLGCFATGTEVLTARGWIAIEQVKHADLVWDGIAYVAHDGVVWQGKKYVIEMNGVLVTPEHKILSGSQWRTASSIAENSQYLKSALDTAHLPLGHISSVVEPVWQSSNAYVTAEISRTQNSITSLVGAQEVVMYAPSNAQQIGSQPERTTLGGNTPISSQAPYSGRTKFSTEFNNVLPAGLLSVKNVVLTVLARVTSFTSQFLRKNATTVDFYQSTCRTLKQLGCIRSGTTCSVGLSESLTVEAPWFLKIKTGTASQDSFKTQKNFLGMRKDQTVFNSIESTTTEATVAITADLQHSKKTSLTQVDTYDILNCGPNSRFVIRTRSGAVIAHNCGYGLGAKKFVAYSEKAGTEITEDFSQKAIKAYRAKHGKIVRYWGDVENCAIKAVTDRRTEANAVVLRNLSFFMSERWLCIKLPSGRLLRYYRPKVVPVEKWGQPSLQLQFKVEFRGRMISESTYGGKLVENITQAVARDVLVTGMFNAEKAKYPVIGTVHDEIVTEQEEQAGSVEELVKAVCQLPQWAVGLPIAAEGFESHRYRK